MNDIKKMTDEKILNWLDKHCHSISESMQNGKMYKVISWFDRANVHQYTYGSDLRDCVIRASKGEVRSGTNLFTQLPDSRVYKL